MYAFPHIHRDRSGYLDRPNNPTGQTIPLPDVDRIVFAARNVGAYVFVDEAYGDFLPREESVVTLWGHYDNLLILRSMSKGFGLANLRAGYLLTDASVGECLVRAGNPYGVSDTVREICAAALADSTYPISHMDDIRKAKEAITQQIGKRLKILPTDPRVPICTLHWDVAADLQTALLLEGILAVSGKEFDGVDERFVRIRVPEEQDMPRLLSALKKLEHREIPTAL